MFTVQNIRSKLRDTTELNDFLNEEEFGDPQIQNAMEQAVSYWNSSAPLLESLEYTDSSHVPAKYSERFIKGTIAVLLNDQVHVLSRNRQPVQTEGVSTDIHRRMDVYKKVADQYLNQFLQWIGMIKHALASQGIVTANPTYEIPVFKFTQETDEEQSFKIYDKNGEELTLNNYDIFLVVKEYNSARDPWVTKTLTVNDSNEAVVDIAEDDFLYAGVVFGELKLVSDSKTKHRFPVYVDIEPALDSENSRNILTVDELRETLKDRVGENFIVENVEFSDALLAKAVTDTVNYWNSAPPLIKKYTYTNLTFPEEFIVNWEDGAVGYALKSLAANLLRNMINPAESDLQNIAQKAEMYNSLADQKIKMFQQWVQNQKRRLNLSAAWGGSGVKGF